MQRRLHECVTVCPSADRCLSQRFPQSNPMPISTGRDSQPRKGVRGSVVKCASSRHANPPSQVVTAYKIT